jgi:serine/threonine-protein kinase
VARVPAPDTQPADGISDLLRKRLGVIAVILLGVHSGALLLFLGNMIRGGALSAIAFNGVLWTVEAVYVPLLWGARPLSLRALRALEVALFGMLMVGYAGYICSPVRLGSLEHYAGLLNGSLSALSASVALPGFAFLVIYGTFIPNTGRRCAVVVGGMALSPLLVAAAFGLVSPGIESDLLLRFLVQLALVLAFGAAIAIYGSHRIESLRQEALATGQYGQYQLKRLLGAGGMGRVYLAEHLLLRRPCALKLIRPELAGNPETLLRFEREVRAMATLTHPNAVEIFDYGRTAGGTFYYVMEYLPGLSLQELVDGYGPVAPARAVHLLRQVCAALDEAHAGGLLHRDIKPGNILICKRGRIHDVAKLLDFGLARAVAPARDGGHLGRPSQAPGNGTLPGGLSAADDRPEGQAAPATSLPP